jgi:hypothetical protein
MGGKMKKILLFCLTVGFVCCWFFGFATNSHADDLQFDAAFTIRDSTSVDGIPDEIDDGKDGIWGLITNTDTQYDEFFLEFPLSNLTQPAGSARFYVFFSGSVPDVSAGTSIALNVAVYEGDGLPNINKFGTGTPLDSISITNIEENVFSVDVTNVLNDFINRDVSHLGIRLYGPSSSISETGRPAQLEFDRGFVSIVAGTPTDLQDTLHPAGAVHARPILKWYDSCKTVELALNGYVLDELSIAKYGGIGISRAYIEANGKIIVLFGEDAKGQPVNLLDEAGRFNVRAHLKPNKSGLYQMKLYAADTNAEAPNFGLVDSTTVYVPCQPPKKDKDGKTHKK